MTLLIFIKCNSLVRKLNEWNSTFIVNENDPVTIDFFKFIDCVKRKKKRFTIIKQQNNFIKHDVKLFNQIIKDSIQNQMFKSSKPKSGKSNESH